MPASPQAEPVLWDQLSPITQVGADAPPFLVISGTHDGLVFHQMGGIRRDEAHAALGWPQDSAVVSAIAIGYPGMPHMIVRYMTVKDEPAAKRAAWISLGWASPGSWPSPR